MFKVRYVGFQCDLYVSEQTNISGYELLKPLNQRINVSVLLYSLFTTEMHCFKVNMK